MMNMKSRPSRSKGISLLEVLVAAIILAVGFLGLIRLQAYLAAGNVLADQRTEAVILGQQKVEDLKSFETLPASSSLVAFDEIASGQDSIVGINTTYSRQWTVTTTAIPDQKAVNIVIRWTTNLNESQSIVYDTVISKTDPARAGEVMTLTVASIGPAPGNSTGTSSDTSSESSPGHSGSAPGHSGSSGRGR